MVTREFYTFCFASSNGIAFSLDKEWPCFSTKEHCLSYIKSGHPRLEKYKHFTVEDFEYTLDALDPNSDLVKICKLQLED